MRETNKWWMVFKRFPPEPKRFRRLTMGALCAVLLLLTLAALSARFKHGSWVKEPQIKCQALNCPDQKEHLDYLRKEARDKLKAAEERKARLKRVRSDDSNEHFSRPWSWFESEIAQLDRIIRKSEDYRMPPLAAAFPGILIFIFFSLIIYLLIGRLAVLHAKSILPAFESDESGQIELGQRMGTHVLFGLLIAFCMILAELFTSVLATDKTWFGWDSFCVTPSAFVIKCIAFIPFGLAAAVPITMLWCFSDRKFLPNLNPSAKDRKFGAGRYVQFLQTWTLWLVLAPSALGIIWFRYVVEMEPNFSPARLLHGIGIAVPITLIVYRLIRNAIILRFRIEEELNQLEGDKDKLPSDPTIAFIGTAWWKLPATIGTAFAAIWALLEGLGLSKHFLDLIY